MAMLAPEGASAVLSWGGDLLRARQASDEVELDRLWLAERRRRAERLSC